jgi:sensor histidine kinase regulating citrate/malate metabolism
MDQEPRRISLKLKIGGIFTAVVLVLCLLVIAAVYQLTRDILRDQLDKRAIAMATNLSDAAAGHILTKNVLALHALTRKYTLFDGVAYAYIEDGKGEILAHTFGTFPLELRQAAAGGVQRMPHRRELLLGEKAVFEAGVPVLDGQAGVVHVGFWADAIQKEIASSLLRLIAVIGIVPIIGALVSFLLAHWIVQPIVGLTEVADKVTMGDLETSIGGACVKSRDEIGDLARSLERMRSSLKAAMLRLGRETA